MVTRAEAAAGTRSALVAAASELLDEGGPGAVTLREVGARAGVSRGAPYGHFPDKEHLLIQLAVDAWDELADRVEALRTEAAGTPDARLESALRAFIEVGRRRPRLYALMFSTRADDPTTARSAHRVHDAFTAVIADLVGPSDALSTSALLMAGAHGIAGLEISGHLAEEKWDVDGDDLVRMLVDGVRARLAAGPRE